jgi:hypothetical protein
MKVLGKVPGCGIVKPAVLVLVLLRIEPLTQPLGSRFPILDLLLDLGIRQGLGKETKGVGWRDS